MPLIKKIWTTNVMKKFIAFLKTENAINCIELKCTLLRKGSSFIKRNRKLDSTIVLTFWIFLIWNIHCNILFSGCFSAYFFYVFPTKKKEDSWKAQYFLLVFCNNFVQSSNLEQLLFQFPERQCIAYPTLL